MALRGKRIVMFVLAAAFALVAACTPPQTGTGNPAPVAVLTADPVTGAAPLTVNFSMLESHDDTAIASFTWDFGDGSPLDTASETPTHVYTTAGTYLAKLTVKDTGNRTGSATQRPITAASCCWVKGLER